MRYGHIMAEYSRLANIQDDETEQAFTFAPFAGTEGYSPVAYIPYIVAAEIGHLLKLDFPGMLLLMRFFGLVASYSCQFKNCSWTERSVRVWR